MSRTKRCLMCLNELVLDDKHFIPNPHTADGYTSFCRLCMWRAEQQDLSLKPGITFGKAEWQFALNYWNYQCAYCGKHSLVLQKEHFMPVALGGFTEPDNILPACYDCNYDKLAHFPLNWLFNRFGADEGRKIYHRIKEFFRLAKEASKQRNLSLATQGLDIL